MRSSLAITARVLACASFPFLGAGPGNPGAGPGELAGRRPNVILILSDDQGYGDLGRNGNPVVRTPNLDRLLDEGIRFEDFHVSPTCSPSRAALLTGRHEFESGVSHTGYERERLSLRSTTIAEVLRSAGYATGIFGKWHLGDEERYRPDRRGFDETFIHGGGVIGQTLPGSGGDAPKNGYFDPVILHDGIFEKTRGYCTDVFFAQALRWIEAVRAKGPFFCYLAPNAPHAPLDVPPEYEQLYAGKVERSDVAKFLGMVTNIDANVGALLAKLREWGIERETLVVFMNDNGGTTGILVHNAGMRGGKTSATNGGTRAMSLWRWPGALAPGSRSALTAHLDVFPTLAELAGAKVPEAVAAELDGASLVPLLEQPDAPWNEDRMLFTHVGRWPSGRPPVKHGDCSVRWRQYLLVRAAKTWQLHDLAADPGETRDVAEANPQVVEQLSQAYDAWWERVLPRLDNEDAYETAPEINPFKELYWAQYEGPGPNDAPPKGPRAARKNR